MGQNTETCNDSRSTEVSVIRFVTRNRTIEEISPKKVQLYVYSFSEFNDLFKTNHCIRFDTLLNSPSFLSFFDIRKVFVVQSMIFF